MTFDPQTQRSIPIHSETPQVSDLKGTFNVSELVLKNIFNKTLELVHAGSFDVPKFAI